MNISSIVVQAPQKYFQEILLAIKSSDFCEYHLHDELGRIIVTIEGEGISEEIAKLKKIQAIPHVLSAEMAFAYSAEELESERGKLENNDKLPWWLNDPEARPRDIRYNGDLKGQF